MRNLYRKISIVIAVVMTFALFITGCGQSTQQSDQANATTNAVTSSGPSEPSGTPEQPDDGIDTSKYVVLKAYMLGDKQEDHDLVWGEINKGLKEKINATVEVNLIGWGEYEEKYPLVLASGEDFDLIYTASWAKYLDQAIKGAFLALTEDMLKKYANRVYEGVPEAGWKQAKVNGKIYMVPTNNSGNPSYAIFIRGDLREKYGLPEIQSLEDYEKFLEAVSQNEKGIFPYGDNNANNYWLLTTVMLNQPNNWRYIDCGGYDMMHYVYTDPDSKPFFRYDKPEYLEYLKKVAEWKKKGYWSNSSLTEKTDRIAMFSVGKSASAIDHIGKASQIYNDWKNNHPEWKLEIYDSSFGGKLPGGTYLGDGMAIRATSKNPERALMAIDYLTWEKDINDLVRHGIRGRHYDLTPDGKKISLPDASKYTSGYSMWNFDVLPQIESADAHPKYSEINSSQLSRKTSHPLDAFALNTENIKTEYAACSNLFAEYQAILELGFSNDIEKDLNDFITKIYAAGFDKIVKEIERQAAEYIAEYNK